MTPKPKPTGASLASWYCLQVEPQQEMTVAMSLGDVGCGVYCPTRWVHIPRRGSKRKEEPLRKAFPLLTGYLFAQAPSDGDLFSKLAMIQRRDGPDVAELREALIGYGEVIDERRLAWAARTTWQASRVRSVLSSSGAPIIISQSAIDAIVSLENDLRFVDAPPVNIALVLTVGDRVTVTLGPGERKAAVIAGRPRKGLVSVEVAGERHKVSVSSVRLAA